MGNKNDKTDPNLVRFFGEPGYHPNEIPGKSAFSQSRYKISWELFRDLFDQTVRSFYTTGLVKKWKGLRLWAMDGSGLRLPDIQELGERFGWHQNQYNKEPSARMRAIYDLMNNICVRITLTKRQTDELTSAVDWAGDIPKDVVMI